MSSLYKRGRVWWIQWYENGEKHCRSTGIKIDLDPMGKIAKQVQRDLDSKMARLGASVDDPGLSLKEAFEKWLGSRKMTSPQYQKDRSSMAARIIKWFEKNNVLQVEHITLALVEKYLGERSPKIASKTMKEELDMIKASVRIANRSRRFSPISMADWPTVKRTISKKPERIGAYSQDEVDRILQDVGTRRQSKHWMLTFMSLAYLGCRWSELARIRIGDVRIDETPPSVRIESRKTAKTSSGQYRWVEIHPKLREELLPIILGRKPEELLLNVPNLNQGHKVLEFTCKKLGIQYKRLHGLRHFWITSMLESGCPLSVVMAMCGHRNLGTTQRYLHLQDRYSGWISKAIS